MTHFFSLGPDDQRDAFRVAAEQLRRPAIVIEKDLWLCWTLGQLYECPGLPAMAFKGGTSLSKVYRAIDRFSEDIDITMDCTGLIDGLEPFGDVSRNQRQRDDNALRAQVTANIDTVITPFLADRIAALGLPADRLTRVGEDTLVLEYARLTEDERSYFREGVKIEFGGRNMTEPHERHTLTPYLAEVLPDFEYPSADVQVLAPQRTFWEKFTLAHAESNRPDFNNADRQSRHWHDLAVLSSHEIGRTAVTDLALLSDVVRVKKRFYNTGFAQYDLCLQGQAKLLPDSAGLDLLRTDYQSMINAGMLRNDLPFDEVLQAVSGLQNQVNAAFR